MEHRVQKILSNRGYCSRRKAEELIEQGKVTVNGEVIGLGDKAAENDVIKVDGKVITSDRKVYLMFHKPKGCVTALNDPVFDTVMDHINVKERVFPVGRLDYNTSGLLLFTNDGDFSNMIMHPRYETRKTYLVKLDKALSAEDVKKVKSGVKLKDCFVDVHRVNIDKYKVEIEIHIGKKHVIKRLFKKLGYNILMLKRIKINNLKLDVESGKYRRLNGRDLEMLGLVSAPAKKKYKQ